MSKLSLKDKMWIEAIKRLDLLEASEGVKEKIKNGRELTKCIVDFENHTLREACLTPEELKMVTDFQEKYEVIVYYVIRDEGLWPDGCTFQRYSLLYVSKYESEWEMDKEDAIKCCKTVPAYVVNMEEPECSEITEIGYRTIEGAILNIT